MSGQPVSCGDDPFLRIIAILSAWFDYLLQAIEATCGDRHARTIASAGDIFYLSTYFLEGDGSEAATPASQQFVLNHPPPDASAEFEHALQQARKLAAEARIPFMEVDLVLQQIETDHNWLRRLKVISRTELMRLFTGCELTQPTSLHGDCMTQQFLCKQLYGRLRAFSDYVRGAGLFPDGIRSPNSSRPVPPPEPIASAPVGPQRPISDLPIIAQPTTPRLVFDDASRTIALDGMQDPQSLKPDVYRFLKALGDGDRCGKMIPGRDIGPGLAGKKLIRVMAKLPERWKPLITSQKGAGGGYCLTLPARNVPNCP